MCNIYLVWFETNRSNTWFIMLMKHVLVKLWLN